MSKNQYFKLDMKERKLWKLTQNMCCMIMNLNEKNTIFKTP